jgi:hypothetical protein
MQVDEDYLGKIRWDSSAEKVSDENFKPINMEQYFDWLIVIGSLQNPSSDITLFKERFKLD